MVCGARCSSVVCFALVDSSRVCVAPVLAVHTAERQLVTCPSMLKEQTNKTNTQTNKPNKESNKQTREQTNKTGKQTNESNEGDERRKEEIK